MDVLKQELLFDGLVGKRGPEVESAHERRNNDNFYNKYLSGVGLDIGYRGYVMGSPVVKNAIGLDLDTPGYDGTNTQYSSGIFDFVFASHVLEHIDGNPTKNLREWLRVIKPYGYLCITVPHQYLYERKECLPSPWNLDHKRFYTPGLLLAEIERAFEPNSYRVVYVKDCADGYNYETPMNEHPVGEYSIECVIQKINKPSWGLK